MSKIRLKIKKKSHLSLDSSRGDSRIDLRNNQKTSKRFLSKKQLILVVFSLLAAVLAGYFISLSKEDEFGKIIPPNAVVSGLISQDAFYQQVSSSGDSQIPAQIEEFLSQSDLNLRKDIQPLFKDKAAFVLFPSNSEALFPLVLILKEKERSSETGNILEAIKPNLEKNWNIFSQIYRQVEVKTLKPVISFSVNLPKLYVFVQIEDCLIIGNSPEAVKLIINSILDN